LGDKIETTEIETIERHYARLYRRCAKRYGAYWKTGKGWKQLARKRQSPSAKAPHVQ